MLFSYDPTAPDFLQYIEELGRSNPSHPDYLRMKRIEEELDAEEIKWAKDMVKLTGQDEPHADNKKLTDDDEIILAYCNGTGPFAD